MLCCIANCNFAYAQAVPQEKIEVVERLADGSMILSVDGKQYRAVTPEQIRKFQEAKVNAASLAEENNALKLQRENFKKSLENAVGRESLAVEQIKLERTRGDEFKKLFEDERALRLRAEQLPKKKNVFEKILGNPVVQLAIVAVAGTIAAKQ